MSRIRRIAWPLVPAVLATSLSLLDAAAWAELPVESNPEAVAGAHRGLFFDNDFSYLDARGDTGWHLGDRLKQLPVSNMWTVDVGGQYRLRFHREQNIRNSPSVVNALGLTGRDDSFLLHRTRLYANADNGRHLRFYGEMLDAVSEHERNVIPRPIDENRAELQNLFAEVRRIPLAAGTFAARVGRQEIALGEQRLVSPLDWANTRRTFEGARVIWQGTTWDLDGIWLRPLKRDAAHRTRLDAPNLDRQLYGLYAKYKNLDRDHLELYWLAIDYDDVGAGGIAYDTLGGHCRGERCDWLYEFEGGVQFGKNADATGHSAGFVAAGLGRRWAAAAFQPTCWIRYDWASGDNTVGNGFHHYEPLAHKNLGFMDLFDRRNIQDVQLQATASLNEQTTLLLWYHYFMLADRDDVPYTVVMTPFAGLAAGSSGSKELGHELDLVVTRTLSPRSRILLGYSHFFAGNYYTTTAGVPYRDDADFYYVQWHVNF